MNNAERTVQTTIQQAWLNNSFFYFPSDLSDFLPSDCFGAAREADKETFPSKGAPVKLIYAGVAVETDIARDSRTGRCKPRDRGSVRRFYSATGAAIGDKIVITRIAERVFQIELAQSRN